MKKACLSLLKYIPFSVTSILAVSVLLIAWISSLKSMTESGNDSSKVTETINRIISPIFGGFSVSEHFVRKAAHFSEFCVLGILVMLLYSTYKPPKIEKSAIQTAVNCLFVGLLAAVADETIQRFSGRGSSVMDVCLDFSGYITGTAVTFFVVLLISNRKGHHSDT